MRGLDAFSGIFRGALDAKAAYINKEMQVAATYAIAGVLDEDELSTEKILPKAFDKRIASAVAKAVKQTAINTGGARI